MTVYLIIILNIDTLNYNVMKNQIKLLLLILFCINVSSIKAQLNDTLEVQRDGKGVVSFARFRLNPTKKTQNDTLFLKSMLQAKEDDSFKSIVQFSDETGTIYKKFQQYYKGLKVENAEYVVNSKNGIIETINGNFENIKEFYTIPSINRQQALKKALDFVAAKKYKWEDETLENFIKQRKNNSTATYYPDGELVIAKDYLTGSKNFRLAWKFTISSLVPENEQWIYVDAISSQIIGNTPLILDSNIPGTAQTLYSQTVGITCDSYPGGYRLNETRNTTTGHNINIHTWNCLNQSNYTNRQEFSNDSYAWINDSWADISQNRDALDAHWAEEKVIDYWSSIHARNSLNDLGIPILGYVHYYNDTPNQASWDPTSQVMRYGNGDGLIFNSFTSLDIIGHEMGHGITQFTANLTSGNQESGALNEGFSDIWGACIEHWAAPNKQTWLMGEEIPKHTYSCFRNLQNPKDSTTVEGKHPNTYHGQFWDNNGEPHTNSTVLSHWFYLLSQGGSGTNDLLNAFSVTGIGIESAQQIAYKTEKSLYSAADYNAARNASIQASRTNGVDTYQTASVTDAWYAVGIGGRYQYNLSGPLQICSQAIYTIDNLPPGATVSWNATPSGIVTYSSTNNTATLTKTGSGWITLTATINNSYTTTKNISVGPPYSFYVSDVSNLYDDGYTGYSFKILPANGNYANEGLLSANDYAGVATNYEWSFYSNIPRKNIAYWSAVGNRVDVGAKNENSGIILKCTATNTCGSNYALYTFYTGYMAPPPLPLIITPNPASTQAELSIGADAITSRIVPEYDITVVDSYGRTVYKTTVKNKKFNIPTSSFLNGIYAVVVTDGTYVYQNKLVVKH